MEERFNIFVPVDVIEKGKKDENGLPEELRIAGVASSMKSGNRDKDGQILNVNGFDFKPFLQKGFLNLEHRSREDYSYIIGEPTNAYVKDGEFHVEGKLYKDNPKAVAVYQLAQTLKKAGSTRTIGYSIEGKAKEKDPNDPNFIKSAVITGMALTVSPKCDGTRVDILKGGDVQYEKQPGSELLIDITDDNGVRWTVDSDLNIEKGGPGSGRKKVGGKFKNDREYTTYYSNVAHLDKQGLAEKQFSKEDVDHARKYFKKAMVAGSITGTDTTDQNLTQEPLKQESVEGKKKKKKLAIKDQMSKGEVLNLLTSEFNLDAESCKNVWGLIERIEKGGPGSRGGKIIGHTKSGKPIYADSSHKAHKNFSVSEHSEAGKIRRAYAHKQNSKIDNDRIYTTPSGERGSLYNS